MGSGFHGRNGLDRETIISLIKTYVLPVLTYGLEIVLPSGKNMECLSANFHYTEDLLARVILPNKDSAFRCMSASIGSSLLKIYIEMEYVVSQHWLVAMEIQSFFFLSLLTVSENFPSITVLFFSTSSTRADACSSSCLKLGFLDLLLPAVAILSMSINNIQLQCRVHLKNSC
jgi:hypothetical protein